MKKPILLGTLWLAGLAYGRAPSCEPKETQVIETRASCTEEGVAIGMSPDESSTYSCLENKTVQNRCGPDGSLTRLRAFQLWMKRTKEFETACMAKGGQFSYEDPLFAEPSNESFCNQAVPQMSSNMFEDTLCNFQSSCPAITVRCEQSCGDRTLALID